MFDILIIGEEIYIYETTSVDTDEDGLVDSHELWELNSNLNSKDTYGDGLDDYYEVTYLGTNVSLYTADVDSYKDGLTNLEEYKLKTDPYRADSDFDGYNDKVDAEPLKTDLSNRDDYTSYTTDVHVGMYDIKTTETDEDETLVVISNVYGGVTKWEDYNEETLAYYYDGNNNNIANVVKYTDGTYNLNTYTYDKDGNITYITHNGFGYTFTYTEEGGMTGVWADGVKLTTSEYETIVLPEEETDESETTEETTSEDTETTSEESEENTVEVQKNQVYGNGDRYDYTYSEDGEDLLTVSINNSLAYEMTCDEVGNPLQYRDGMNFTWTNGRSLETVTKGDLTTSYKYNQDNLRTSEMVNGVTTTYICEDSTLIAEETDGIVTWYMYG